MANGREHNIKQQLQIIKGYIYQKRVKYNMII